MRLVDRQPMFTAIIGERERISIHGIQPLNHDQAALHLRRATLVAAGEQDVEARDLSQQRPPSTGARCRCSRPACGHPDGCTEHPQPNVALGSSDMAMYAPRGLAHAHGRERCAPSWTNGKVPR